MPVIATFSTFRISALAVSCVIKLDLKPVLVDAELKNWNMIPDQVIKKITKAEKKILIKTRKEGEIKTQLAPVQRDDTPFAQREWEAKEQYIISDEDNPEKEYFVAQQKVDGKYEKYKKEVTKDQNWVRAWTRSDMIKNIADSRKQSMVTAPFKIVNLLKFPASPFHFIGSEVEYADPYNFSLFLNSQYALFSFDINTFTPLSK